MKMFKKKDGFTLVELIVVIAILAILAGVAIPAYSGYLEKAKDASVITELDALVTACQGANAEKGAITAIDVADDGKTVLLTGTLDTDKFESNFKLFFNDASATLDASTNTITLSETAKIDFTGSSYAAKGAEWNGTKWVVGTP